MKRSIIALALIAGSFSALAAPQSSDLQVEYSCKLNTGVPFSASLYTDGIIKIKMNNVTTSRIINISDSGSGAVYGEINDRNGKVFSYISITEDGASFDLSSGEKAECSNVGKSFFSDSLAEEAPDGMYYCDDIKAKSKYAIVIGERNNIIFFSGKAYEYTTVDKSDVKNPLNDFTGDILLHGSHLAKIIVKPTQATLIYSKNETVNCSRNIPQNGDVK